MSVISSTVGGLVSVVALMFLAPPLAKAVIAFGSAEMFLLAILGLTIIVSLSKDSLTKGMMVGLFGMLLSVVGTDTLTGQDRYTMGIMQLYGGIDSVAAVIGMYSASQVFKLAAQKRRTIQYDIGDSISQLKPVSLKVIAKNWFNMIRSGVIGTYVGIPIKPNTSIIYTLKILLLIEYDPNTQRARMMGTIMLVGTIEIRANSLLPARPTTIMINVARNRPTNRA